MKVKKFIFLLVALFFIPFIKVSAASFSLGASSRSVIVGSNVTIYVNGSDVTGRVNISSSNTSVLSSGTNSLWIEPSGSVTFNAKKVGSATITVTGASLSDGSGNDVSLGSKSITINVVEKPKAASSNNSLKSLKVDDYDLEPVFDPGTTEYSLTVKQGTESIKISAVPDDSSASVSGTGDIAVFEGLNVLNVVVTAQNGYQKEYKLNVTVEEEPIVVRINDIDMSIVKQENALPQVSSLYSPSTMEYKYTVDGEEKTVTIPTYVSDTTGYTLVGIKDNKGKINLYIYDNNKFSIYNELSFNGNIVIFQKDAKNVPNGYKKTTLSINDQDVIAYQKDKNDYYLIYGQNVNTNDIGWYKYDKVDNSIQRYDIEEIEKLESDNHKYLTVIYVFSGITVLMLFSVIILLVKIRNNRR